MTLCWVGPYGPRHFDEVGILRFWVPGQWAPYQLRDLLDVAEDAEDYACGIVRGEN